MNKILKLILIIIFFNTPHTVLAESYDDKIMAIVNDRVILKSEIQIAIDYLAPEIIQKEYVGLNDQQVIKKVLTNLIETSLLVQAADRFGIKISDIALENKLAEIARSKKMTINELRSTVIQQGQDYTNFIQDIKNQMTIETLFVTQFYSRMNVTEEEIENFIEREKINQYGDFEYDLIEFVIIDEEKLLTKDDINNIYTNIKEEGFLNTKNKYSNMPITIKTLGVVAHNNLPNIL